MSRTCSKCGWVGSPVAEDGLCWHCHCREEKKRKTFVESLEAPRQNNKTIRALHHFIRTRTFRRILRGGIKNYLDAHGPIDGSALSLNSSVKRVQRPLISWIDSAQNERELNRLADIIDERE